MPNGSSTIDALFGELRHRYRGQVLTFFDESGADTAHIDELVEYLGNRSSGTPDTGRLAVALHHSALPALADAGFIEYNPETHTVRYREDSRLESALDLVAELRESPPCRC